MMQQIDIPEDLLSVITGLLNSALGLAAEFDSQSLARRLELERRWAGQPPANWPAELKGPRPERLAPRVTKWGTVRVLLSRGLEGLTPDALLEIFKSDTTLPRYGRPRLAKPRAIVPTLAPLAPPPAAPERPKKNRSKTPAKSIT